VPQNLFSGRREGLDVREAGARRGDAETEATEALFELLV
jgi:hypothetical protein